ncbi:hypothetical protein Fcan01_25242 [Folsomia candida]|uniref:Uncharacterized protein n=1 Tax=Folsomia candida TaxID=158441 RepID=A0A226D5J3_FOLCA|nr:hypothetical protein Fcan01_25242 [Folsomia candida]
MDNLPWLAPWALAIVKVEAIQISGNSVMSSIFIEHMQKIGPLSFPKLTEFFLPNHSHSQPVSLGLDFLLGMKQPLRSLHLSEPLTMENFHKFETLVEKHAKSLEHLGFIVSTEEDATNGLQLRLPALPKLQDLYFSVEQEFYRPRRTYAMVTLTFPGDSDTANYKEHLPSIRSMRIYPGNELRRCTSWEKYGDFFDTFLPKKDTTSSNKPEVCTTLKRLYIPYEIGRHPRIPYPQAAELAGMFPNVGEKFMMKFKKTASQVIEMQH